MPYQKQEPQTFRQFIIIKRLYALEMLQGSLLAQEYAVSARTLEYKLLRWSILRW